MEINRTNYEIWLIDLLEGTLSDELAEQAIRFLEQNPDIREEFDDLGLQYPVLNKDVYKNKDIIRKKVSEVPDSQFELLCTAYYEGDLQSGSIAELKEIIDSCADRKRTFELMATARLVPPAIVYKNKNQLVKTTPFQRVIRLSLIGLSIAAAIAILISLPHVTLPSLSEKPDISAQRLPVYATPENKYFEIPAGNPVRVTLADTRQLKIRAGIVSKSKANLTDTIILKPIEREISLLDTKVAYLNFQTQILTEYADLYKSSFSMPAFSNMALKTPVEQVYMSNVERFITKIFRERVLGEKVTRDTPLKGYEIAEAGVEGLNKLLGWEMALNEKNDANGELKSVYFSSKILKFNAPVKKNTNDQ